MEDNNVNNILNNENEISTLSTISSAEGNLNFSERTDETAGIGGGNGGTSSGSTSSGSSSSTGTPKASSDNLTPILLILGDGTDPEPPVVDEEPVLLEEDDDTYKVDHNDNDHYGTTENCINFRNEDGAMSDFDNEGETSCSENILIGLEDDKGLLTPIDSNSITMTFTNGGETWCDIKLYKATDTNQEILRVFGKYKDVTDLDKLWVPLVTVSENTGSERDTIVTFNINNSNMLLLRKISAYIKQMSGSGETPTEYKYTVYLIIELKLTTKMKLLFENLAIIGVSFCTGTNDFNDGIVTNLKMYAFSYISLVQSSDMDGDVYISPLMYGHNIPYNKNLDNYKTDTDELYSFILSIPETYRLSNPTNLSTSYLPTKYLKDINSLLPNNVGGDIRVIPKWIVYSTLPNCDPEIIVCSPELAFASSQVNTFYGYYDNYHEDMSIYDLSYMAGENPIQHIIIYNETTGNLVYDYNWKNWAKKTDSTGEYNIIARTLWNGDYSMVNANVSTGNLFMTIGTTQTPNDINVLQGNVGNYKISDLLFLIENNRLSINADGEQFSYLAHTQGLVHNSGYDFTDEYGDYYVIDVSDKITLNGTVVNLKDIDNFASVTICLWFRVGANQPVLIGTIDLGGIWPNKEELYIGFYD